MGTYLAQTSEGRLIEAGLLGQFCVTCLPSFSQPLHALYLATAKYKHTDWHTPAPARFYWPKQVMWPNPSKSLGEEIIYPFRGRN